MAKAPSLHDFLYRCQLVSSPSRDDTSPFPCRQSHRGCGRGASRRPAERRGVRGRRGLGGQPRREPRQGRSTTQADGCHDLGKYFVKKIGGSSNWGPPKSNPKSLHFSKEQICSPSWFVGLGHGCCFIILLLPCWDMDEE